MPNHVEHHITIHGPAQTISEIRSVIESGQSMMERYIPLPAEAIETKTFADGSTYSVFADGGYEMALDLWGTKWGDYDTRVCGEGGPDTELDVAFASAWGQLRPGLDRLSGELGITIVAAWMEEQPAFCGWAVIENGIEIAGGDLDVEALHDEVNGIEDDDDRWDLFHERSLELFEEAEVMAEDAYARIKERRRAQV